jgi:hypothetical protein
MEQLVDAPASTSSLFGAELPDALLPFKASFSPAFFKVRRALGEFIEHVVLPRQAEYVRARAALKREARDRGEHPLSAPQPPILNELRAAAKARGLWNFFIERGGLTNLEYAPIAELLGAFPLANVAMNCSAPDTGNMEVLEKYGTPAQKDRWLVPLLKAEIRSCFIMTEPGVASSDATNISTRIEEYDADHYVINGHKWWISGSVRPECKLGVLLGKTSFEGPRHSQQSMILVPMDTPGINILHPLEVFGEVRTAARSYGDSVSSVASVVWFGLFIICLSLFRFFACWLTDQLFLSYSIPSTTPCNHRASTLMMMVVHPTQHQLHDAALFGRRLTGRRPRRDHF